MIEENNTLLAIQSCGMIDIMKMMNARLKERFERQSKQQGLHDEK